RECRRPLERPCRWVRARQRAPAAPAIGVVAVEIRAFRGRAWRRLAVLAPRVEVPTGDVELGAIGVDDEDDPDLATVDDRGDPWIGAVALGQPVEDACRHLWSAW